MDDLVTWLRAQLDDDERVAQSAYYWSPTGWFDVPDSAREHLDRWDPARVLAEVDAKRRILDGMIDDDGFLRGNIASGTAWPVIVLLAAAYADRPGYREEWRP